MTQEKSYISSACLLILGCGIYIAFREPVVFTLPLIRIGLKVPIFTLQHNCWCDFLRYTLPDFLWDTAILIYSLTIKNKIIRILAIILAPLYEICQFIGIIKGTFDFNDLFVYLLLTLIFLIRWKKTESNLSPSSTDLD